MAVDALIQLQPSVTKTASFTSAPLVLVAGTPFRGDRVRVLYSAASNASGANSVTFQVAVSKDNGATFNVEAQADPITLSTTAQASEILIPFSVRPSSVVNGIQIELIALFGGAGATPTITYTGDFGIN
jgi:hypothetical protein